LTLIGPDVTDAHLKQVKALSTLRIIVLDQTSVSDDGVTSLRKALPSARIDVLDAERSSVKWRTDNPTTAESHD
jgi:hypothetical protein